MLTSIEEQIKDNISSQFISHDNDLNKGEKSDLHFEWKDVTRNGRTFKQRYRIRNKETDTSLIRDKKRPFGGDSSISARLKDRLVYSHYYNNNFYDTQGERINIPEHLKDEALSVYHNVSSKDIGIDKKNAFMKVLPLLEKKDQFFEKEVGRRKGLAEKLNDPNSKIDFLYRESLKVSNQTSGRELKSIIDSLMTVFHEDLDPIITIKRKGKETDLPLSQLQEALQIQISSGKGTLPLDIQSFDIKNLSDLDKEDFKQVQPNLDHADIYKTVNKKINKVDDKD